MLYPAREDDLGCLRMPQPSWGLGISEESIFLKRLVLLELPSLILDDIRKLARKGRHVVPFTVLLSWQLQSSLPNPREFLKNKMERFILPIPPYTQEYDWLKKVSSQDTTVYLEIFQVYGQTLITVQNFLFWAYVMLSFSINQNRVAHRIWCREEY